MKMNNVFDILENAEDDSMERLTDKCPEISDAQLDKILAMSEKKYKMRKKEIEGTKKDNNIKMTENGEVSGVEHSSRPAWYVPLRIAASLVLVAGVAIGSTVMLKRNSGIVNDGGKIPPAATATTSSGTGTTLVTDDSSTTTKSGTTDKNGSAVKVGSGVVTTVTAAVTDKKGNSVNGTGTGNSGGSSGTAYTMKDFAGTWQYQVAERNVELRSTYNGMVVIKENGTYSYTDANGYTSSGKVEISDEEIGGTHIATVNFYENGAFQFGGFYLPDKLYEISIGNDGTARLVRGEDAIKYSEYQSTAYDLIEKYYEMIPQFGFRFRGYLNLKDTVKFKIANPYSNGQIDEVEFARISGNGFEFNSMDDLIAYRKTVYSEEFANRYPVYGCKTVSSSYNDGDYIDESNSVMEDWLYYSSFIMYKGNLYANTLSPAKGWIGHVPTNEPIVITDVTSTSFKAYYSSLMGDYGSIAAQNCDIVDFVLDPSCGEWRINDLTSTDYSVYQSKAAESKY